MAYTVNNILDDLKEKKNILLYGPQSAGKSGFTKALVGFLSQNPDNDIIIFSNRSDYKVADNVRSFYKADQDRIIPKGFIVTNDFRYCIVDGVCDNLDELIEYEKDNSRSCIIATYVCDNFDEVPEKYRESFDIFYKVERVDGVKQLAEKTTK